VSATVAICIEESVVVEALGALIDSATNDITSVLEGCGIEQYVESKSSQDDLQQREEKGATAFYTPKEVFCITTNWFPYITHLHKRIFP
jgi:hypothetical protein